MFSSALRRCVVRPSIARRYGGERMSTLLCTKRLFSTESSNEEHKKQKVDVEKTESFRHHNARPATWPSVIIIGLAALGGLAWYQRDKQRRLDEYRKVTTVGKAKIGGEFDVTDIHGNTINSKQIANGKYLLIYFGFTMCPDICPVELEKLKNILNILGKETSKEIQPIFISIDPKRDTPARLVEYAKKFDDRIAWFTGTDDQIKKVARLFRVYYSIPEIKPGEDEAYLVDHSIFFYLMDRDGDFLEFFGKNFSAGEVATKIKKVTAL